MKQAYIILAHNNLDQLTMLIEKIKCGNIIIVHIDKKINSKEFIGLKNKFVGDNIHFIDKRFNCVWGDYSIIRATNNCIKYLVELKEEFSHAILLSGSDFPIKSQKSISEYLNNNLEKDFIEGSKLNRYANHERYNIYYFKWAKYVKNLKVSKILFRAQYKLSYLLRIKREHPIFEEVYFGSQWWVLSKETLQNVEKFIRDNNKYDEFYINTNIPDEFFYQTIVFNKFNKNIENRNLHYIEWENEECWHPNIFTENDKEKLMDSNKFFARKFDINKDRAIIDYLNDNL